MRLALVALAACSTLPHIDANVCGNGIVEVGEDCDGASATGTCGAADTANACHFVCDGSAACPADSVCGHDGRCRVPTATFAAPLGPYTIPASDLGVGDVDGDGFDDLVGLHESTLGVRFGSSTGDLGKLDAQIVPPPSTDTTFGDLDGDGRLDLVFGSGIGAFTFLGSPTGLTPHAYAGPVGMAAGTVVLASAQVQPLTPSVVLAIGQTISYAGTTNTICLDGAPGPPCVNDTTDNLLGNTLVVGRTGFQFTGPSTDDQTDEIAVAFANGTSVTILTPQPNNLLSLLETLPLPPGVALEATGTVGFGRFDTDACTDLMVPVVRGASHGVAIAYGHLDPTGCSGRLDAFVVEVSPGPPKTLVAVVDADGDNITDIVTSKDVELTRCTRDSPDPKCGGQWSPGVSTLTPRAWTAVQLLDINHDGLLDLAGIVGADADVDVMLGTGTGLFNPFPIGTDLPVRFVRAGDFDGDLIDDLAIVTGDSSLGDNELDHLFVVYGAGSGGPGTPVEMGTSGPVEAMVAARLFLDTTVVDLVDGLVVVADETGERVVEELLGSSAHRLLAPFLIQSNSANSPPLALAIGNYDTTSGADVGAIARTPAGVNASAVLSGQGGGDLAGTATALDPNDSKDLDPLLLDGLRWRPLHEPGGDAMVGVTGSSAASSPNTGAQVVVIAPNTGPPAMVAFASTPGATGTITHLRDVAVADFDGDGFDDLAFDTIETSKSASIEHALIAWNHSGQLDVANAQAPSTDATCHDLAAVQLDLDPALELVALCGTTPVLTLFDWTGSQWVVIGTAPSPVRDAHIIAGDFNGDGLADLALVGAQSSAAFVLLQCAKGDPTCAPQ